MLRGDWYRQPPFIIPLLLLVGAVALSVTQSGQQYHAADHYEQSPSHAGENPAGAIQPASGDIPASETDKNQPQAEIQPSERHLFWSDTWAQWIMAIGTVATVGLVAWTVVVTKRMLKEAEDAADAARDAVTVTQEMGEAQTRAYMSANTAKIYRTSKPDDDNIFKFTIRIEIKNTGHSPALNIFGAADAACKSHLELSGVVENKAKISALRTVLAGGNAITENIHFSEMTKPDVKNIIMGQRVPLRVVGFARYDDMFGGVWRLDYAFYLAEQDDLTLLGRGEAYDLAVAESGNSFARIDKKPAK